MKKIISLVVILVLCVGGFYTYKSLSAGSTETNVDVNLTQAYELTKQPNVVILDVRTSKEFQEGHLPNAMLLDVTGANFENEISLLDKNATYLVYCRSGRRSKDAILIMEKLGFNNIHHMKDGIQQWQKSSYPVEQ